jgi:hypothetical protein
LRICRKVQRQRNLLREVAGIARTPDQLTALPIPVSLPFP